MADVTNYKTVIHKYVQILYYAEKSLLNSFYFAPRKDKRRLPNDLDASQTRCLCSK
jgi:hypothetical protein